MENEVATQEAHFEIQKTSDRVRSEVAFYEKNYKKLKLDDYKASTIVFLDRELEKLASLKSKLSFEDSSEDPRSQLENIRAYMALSKIMVDYKGKIIKIASQLGLETGAKKKRKKGEGPSFSVEQVESFSRSKKLTLDAGKLGNVESSAGEPGKNISSPPE